MAVFLIVVAILIVAVAAVFATPLLHKLRLGSGTRHVPELPDGFEDPSPTLPAVLLPETPRPADVDRLRFSLGLRGYRMDQVDEVLDRLRDQLAIQETELNRLRRALSQAQAGTTGAVPSVPVPGKTPASGKAAAPDINPAPGKAPAPGAPETGEQNTIQTGNLPQQGPSAP